MDNIHRKTRSGRESDKLAGLEILERTFRVDDLLMVHVPIYFEFIDYVRVIRKMEKLEKEQDIKSRLKVTYICGICSFGGLFFVTDFGCNITMERIMGLSRKCTIRRMDSVDDIIYNSVTMKRLELVFTFTYNRYTTLLGFTNGDED